MHGSAVVASTNFNGDEGELFRQVPRQKWRTCVAIGCNSIARRSGAVLILTDNDLGRSRDNGQARFVDRAAVELILYGHDCDEHDGRSNTAKHKTHDSKAATVCHDPLPQCPRGCLVARALKPVQAKRLTLGESLSDGSIDKPAARI